MCSNYRLLILAFAVCTALAPASRATDYFVAADADEMIGTWATKTDGRECVISFAADHTFTGKIVSKEGVEVPFKGTWATSPGRLIGGLVSMELHYIYSNFGNLPSGTKDMDVI